MSHTWDPDRYLAYADERGRPFVDLLARVPAETPSVVVDLGCGPGNLTALLADRWRGASVTGIDSSPEMIAAAGEIEGIAWEVADLRDWVRPDPLALRAPVDVLVSNATLQWVPEHLELLPGLLDRVRPGGWLAFQVPGNFDEPSHTTRTELASREPYAEHVRDARVPDQPRPGRLRPRPAGPRLRGRRLGDDVPPRPHRPRPRLRLGLRHRRPADPPGAARRPAPALRGRVPRAAARGLSRGRVRSGDPAVPPDLRRRPQARRRARRQAG